jgi:hypothetical protein
MMAFNQGFNAAHPMTAAGNAGYGTFNPVAQGMPVLVYPTTQQVPSPGTQPVEVTGYPIAPRNALI